MSWADLKSVLQRCCRAAASHGRTATAWARDSARRFTGMVLPAAGRLADNLANALFAARPRATVGTSGGHVRSPVTRGLGALLPRPAGAGGGPSLSLLPDASISRRVLDRPLALAFLISIVIHLVLYGGWRWGKELGWWEHQATWLLEVAKKAKNRADLSSMQEPQVPREIPLTFVQVDPGLASEAPKDAKYYGEYNSIAANPELDVKPEPKIDGDQTKIARVDDVPRPQPLQPVFPEPEPIASAPDPPKPAPETAPAAPEPNRVDVGMTEAKQPDRPRTIREARLRQGLAGEKMHQPGGASRRGRVSLDVKATPFGSYDAAFIAAVQQRWFDLIDSTRLAQRAGKVVLEFRLNYDGSITDMKVRETDVGEMLALLCQRAVRDPAPYPRWPSDMWRLVGKNFRDVVFTFYYN